jgi:signal transduction histidine kinase
MTVQLSMAIAVEVLGASGPDVSLWFLANPMFVPTLLGFATVLYLWRLFQAQADMARKEKYMAERLELARKYESLGLMAGGVAHDFNNLLTTILGNVDLARYDVETGSDLANCLDSIESAADRAAAITRQMLDFSGHGKFAVDPVDLTQIVTDLRDLLASSIPANITVEYKLGENLPRILGDRLQLGQVVANLVRNAADAIGAKPGKIVVQTLAVEADATLLSRGIASQQPKPGTYAALRIADNGPGIDPDIQPRMFDPFVTSRETGRGMGLPAVLGIVRGHHGTVLVDSVPGKGATLTVLLPAKDVAARA